MNLILPTLTSGNHRGLLLSLVCLMMGFQQGYAQHCTPGFHFTIDGYTVTFDDQSSADGTITDFHWAFGDGQTSTEQNPIHIYEEEGTYHVCLTITAHNPGCTATFCHQVVIHAPPPGTCHASFESLQPDPNLQTIDFTDQSTSQGMIGSWAWDFGDGNTSTNQNPTHTYDEPGTYLVCLIITDDDGICTSHVCHHIVVHHPPAGNCHAAFSTHQPDPDQTIIDFTDESTNEGTIGTWAWDFGDGNSSSEQNPSHAYTDPGTYLVCLTITDDDGSCTNHVCHQIIIHHPPAGICHAGFTANQPDPNVHMIVFLDHSTSEGTIGTWHWNFGDGNSSSEQNPTHLYEAPGTFLVCLTITDDDGECTNHVCHHVVVHHPPAGICHTAFSFLQPDPTILTFDFLDESTSEGTIGTWAWSFGDGSTSSEQNPSHTYASPGNYVVCLFTTDDDGECTSHICHHVFVHHPPSDENNMLPLHSPEAPASNFQAYRPTLQPTFAGQSINSVIAELQEGDSDLQRFIINYPNPFTTSTTLQYVLSKEANVQIELYDVTGRRLRQILMEYQSQGMHTEQIDGSGLGTGMYLIKMIAGGEIFTKQITVLNNR